MKNIDLDYEIPEKTLTGRKHISILDFSRFDLTD